MRYTLKKYLFSIVMYWQSLNDEYKPPTTKTSLLMHDWLRRVGVATKIWLFKAEYHFKKIVNIMRNSKFFTWKIRMVLSTSKYFAFCRKIGKNKILSITGALDEQNIILNTKNVCNLLPHDTIVHTFKSISEIITFLYYKHVCIYFCFLFICYPILKAAKNKCARLQSNNFEPSKIKKYALSRDIER